MAWKKYCVEEDFLTIFHEIKYEKPKRETHQVYSFINDIPIENYFIEDYQMIFTHKIGICRSKIPWFIMIFLMKMASWGYTMGYTIFRRRGVVAPGFGSGTASTGVSGAAWQRYAGGTRTMYYRIISQFIYPKLSKNIYLFKYMIGLRSFLGDLWFSIATYFWCTHLGTTRAYQLQLPGTTYTTWRPGWSWMIPTIFGAPMFNMGCEICEMPLKKNINAAQNFDSMTLMKNF